MSGVIGYLDFGGEIQGNSVDAQHQGWIELLSVGQSVQRNIDPSAKPKDALSKSLVQVGAIELQKNADESSPVLAGAVCCGQTFPSVAIEMVRVSGDGNELFYRWELEDAYLSSYAMHGQSFVGMIETTESLTLCYNTIKWSYQKKDQKGKSAGASEAGWDLGANKKK